MTPDHASDSSADPSRASETGSHHAAGQFALLRQRRFAPFFVTQFLGAANDNVFKTALLTALTFDTTRWTTLDPGMLNNLLPGLFILPFLLFSATSGQIVERSDKAWLARRIKLFEIVCMLTGSAGWLTGQLWLLILALVGMGIHSTLFGPLKYAYMPAHLRPQELVGANGLVEGGTFIGILLGEILGVLVIGPEAQGRAGFLPVMIVTVGLAVAGWFSSRAMPVTPSPHPGLKINWNPFSETWRTIKTLSESRVLLLAVLGNSWFWFFGAMMLAQFPLFARDYLHGNHTTFVSLLMCFSAGIGAGSLLCEKLSGGRIEIGLVPLGAIGLTLSGVDLFFAARGYAGVGGTGFLHVFLQPGGWRVAFDVALLGLFGGFFVVPLFALIQTRCAPAHLARTIGAMNVMNSLFMVLSAVVAIVLIRLGCDIPQLFLATALLNCLVAGYIFLLVPEYLLRFIAWILSTVLHRVAVRGLDHIPQQGPALLAGNHVSYFDAILLFGMIPRPVRFVMNHRIFALPVLGWFFRLLKAIPIASAKEDPVLFEAAFREIAQALQNDELVCIFPEGKLTRDGQIDVFRRGILRVLADTPVPVIPFGQSGLWGSWLSMYPGSFLQRGAVAARRGLRSRLSLHFGAPVAASEVTTETLRESVQILCREDI